MQVRSFSGQRLEQARLRKGMTQTDLAFAIRSVSTAKTSERNVRRWEAGTTNAPHAVIVSVLSEVLGIPMDELYETERANGSGDDDEEADEAVMYRAAYALDRSGQHEIADLLRDRARRAGQEQQLTYVHESQVVGDER